jgi:hypothetical protein
VEVYPFFVNILRKFAPLKSIHVSCIAVLSDSYLPPQHWLDSGMILVEIQKGCAVWLKKMILFCLFPQFKAAASFIITELFEEFHSSASQYHIMSPQSCQVFCPKFPTHSLYPKCQMIRKKLEKRQPRWTWRRVFDVGTLLSPTGLVDCTLRQSPLRSSPRLKLTFPKRSQPYPIWCILPCWLADQFSLF